MMGAVFTERAGGTRGQWHTRTIDELFHRTILKRP